MYVQWPQNTCCFINHMWTSKILLTSIRHLCLWEKCFLGKYNAAEVFARAMQA